MINTLKRFVGRALCESGELTDKEQQAQIEKFLAAKRSGETVGSGDIAADLNRQLTRLKNMWLVPFAPLKRSRKHYPGTFGQIIGAASDVEGLRFEFHPKSAWVMTKPGQAIPFVEAIDKLQYEKRVLPEKFPVVVPYGVAGHNPALKAAVDAGLARAVVLNTEDRTMTLGHDESIWALSGNDEQAAAARKASIDAILAAERGAETARANTELEKLIQTQGDDDIGADWLQLSDEYYGSTDAKDDEYDPGGEWKDEFEDEFKRQLNDR